MKTKLQSSLAGHRESALRCAELLLSLGRQGSRAGGLER